MRRADFRGGGHDERSGGIRYGEYGGFPEGRRYVRRQLERVGRSVKGHEKAEDRCPPLSYEVLCFAWDISSMKSLFEMGFEKR